MRTISDIATVLILVLHEGITKSTALVLDCSSNKIMYRNSQRHRRIIPVLLVCCLLALPQQIAIAQRATRHNDGVVILFSSLPGEFVRGRTLRITVVNPSRFRSQDGRKYKMLVAPLILDLDGRPIAHMTETEIPEGGSRSFNFDRNDISLAGDPGTGRLQVNAQIRYRFFTIVDRAQTTPNTPDLSSRPSIGVLKLFDANGKQITQSDEVIIQPGEIHSFSLNRDSTRRAAAAVSDRLQVRASFTLRTIHGEGTEQFQGSLAIVDNQTRRVEALQGWLLVAKQRAMRDRP